MSALGQAVAEKIGLDHDRVESILAKHQVSTSSSKPLPAHLRFERLRFSGTKILTGVNREGVQVAPDSVEQVPFEFDWRLSTGLNGVGSDQNLRGKSSVLKVLMWALRGRCDLKNEVRSWIDRVEVDFTVDTVAYLVEFSVDHNNGESPNGQLRRTVGRVSTVVGTFAGDDQFEEVMGAAMMTALRLPVIASNQEGRRTQHAWPTYAGALVVRGDSLNHLFGEHSWAGLPSRLLSLFVGAEWAAARAEATTAVSIAQIELHRLEEAAKQHASALSEAHTRAIAEVDSARVNVEKLSSARVDMQVLTNALARVSILDSAITEISSRLMAVRAEHAAVSAQYQQEETRRHRAVEDAVAVRFFQQLRPTVCPRCAAPVTQERRDAEEHGANCSVCTSDLALDALKDDLFLAEAALAAGDARSGDGGEDDDEIVDDLDALQSAVTATQQRFDRLDQQMQDAEAERSRLAATVAENSAAQSASQLRHNAELALARAEGAAAALAPADGLVGPDHASMEEVRADLTILNAAKDITATWVQTGQRQWLTDLSYDITNIARAFGISNLTGVVLGGGATMKVMQGGATSNYGDCERGEKLRLKLATAVALIKQGRTIGTGRHPGLLLVDSPGSEEVPEDDFDTILGELHREAAEADIQVFVATRHTSELVGLLGDERCRLGRGTNFVW